MRRRRRPRIAAALYLAAAGIGTLGIVDFDNVDDSNLQRQILHGTPDVGRSKLQSARDRLTAINPEVHVETYETRLTSANALELFKGYDVIVDGTDNFPTRYLVNDACVLLKKPNVYGSIFRFEGQASVFATAGGPCYRCLYPEPPPPGTVPSCAEGGVLGVLPGVIGASRRPRALKLVLGTGSTLVGRLLLFDALDDEVPRAEAPARSGVPDLRRSPDDQGTHRLRRVLRHSSGRRDVGCRPGVPETTVQELKARVDAKAPFFLLDVRETHEFQISRIAGSTLIPLGQLPSRLGEIPTGQEIVVHCKSGQRSARAVTILKQNGIEAKNLKGGILAWIDKVDPTLAKDSAAGGWRLATGLAGERDTP